MADNSKQTKFSESMQIIKQNVSRAANKNKKLFRIIISFLVIFIVVACAASIINNNNVKTSIISAFIPSKIDSYDIVFYSETNPDYDAGNSDNTVFDKFRCYYYPDNDETKDKVYLGTDGIYTDGEYSKNIALNFVLSGLVYLGIFISALRILAAVIFVIAVILAIYMWYRADEKRYKEAQEKIKKMRKRSH